MKKCLLLASLVVLLLPFGVRAQNGFDIPSDTVCVGQAIHLTPHTMNASSYYWGFCSGYLENTPLENNLGSTFQFASPSGIEIAKDGDNYYGFVVNGAGSQLLRLEFGNKLSNIPTVTNFGSLDTTVSPSPNSIFITQDSGKWFVFVCGGATAATSSISRFDFNAHLSNKPNGVRLGNISNLLDQPQGICVFRDGNVYYGFVVNKGNDHLVRLNFGKNISKTPTATDLGNPNGYFVNANDIAPVYDNGAWYLLIPNTVKTGGGPTGGTYNVTKCYFGNTLSNTPVNSQPTGFRQNLTNVPTAISVIKDCGQYYAFITNSGDNSIERVDIPSLASNNWTGKIVVNSTFSSPEDISRFARDRDTLYSFVINPGNNSLTRLTFPQCHHTDIQSSTSAIPPVYHYDSAGVYNVILAVNEGLPNMDVTCQQLTVLSIPPITISHDTLVCQGDTVHLFINSQNALNYYFSPNYNISDTASASVYVYPRQSTNYNIRIPFKNGCEVDTVIKVNVSSVVADAGPDRTIPDGATTVLGGPNTLRGAGLVYQWFPPENINDVFSLYPSVNPTATKTYYLKVTNTLGCAAQDTVVVKVQCNGFTLPNAFMPGNSMGRPKFFGMKNREIVVLYYFRIFDRWGHEVFSTSDPTKEWDGTYKGEPAPFGVYVWEAEGACVNQERIRATGNVTLIR